MHLGRDKNWLIRIAPAAELAKEDRWKALTNDMVLAALESAMGRATNPVPCLCCDRPYDPSRLPRLGVTVEHVEDSQVRFVFGICSACVEVDDLKATVSRKIEVLLDAHPERTRKVAPGGRA